MLLLDRCCCLSCSWLELLAWISGLTQWDTCAKILGVNPTPGRPRRGHAREGERDRGREREAGGVKSEARRFDVEENGYKTRHSTVARDRGTTVYFIFPGIFASLTRHAGRFVLYARYTITGLRHTISISARTHPGLQIFVHAQARAHKHTLTCGYAKTSLLCFITTVSTCDILILPSTEAPHDRKIYRLGRFAYASLAFILNVYPKTLSSRYDTGSGISIEFLACYLPISSLRVSKSFCIPHWRSQNFQDATSVFQSNTRMERGKSLLCLFSILLSARITLQASSPTSTYYVGAAVEYHPVIKGENGTVIADENAKNYLKFLKKASEKDVDIIVFPEGSLTAGRSFPAKERTRYLPHSSYVPDPQDRVIPCKNDSSNVMQALKAISCAANQYSTYIVVNVREKAKCATEKITAGCSTDGYELYNTNVVFDRQGVVVARYRKYHLFGEAGFNKTSKAEISTFRTDFDVTFGQFICFDVLFEDPALRLIRESKITDIVFSTQWYSELPFLMSTAVQSSWSYANNVNFLGAGYNDPAKGSAGSGIYAGADGPLVSLWSEKRANALLVANIPKVTKGRRDHPNPVDSTTYFFTKSEISTIDGPEPVTQQTLLSDDLTPYTTKLFAPTNGTHTLTLCDRGLCCEFFTDTTHHNAIGQNNAKYFRYRFAVFNGVRTFDGKATGGVEICGIISCTDDTPMSCNRRFDTNDIIVHPITFNSIIVAGNFSVGSNVYRMPIALNADLQILNSSDIAYVATNLNQTHANLQFSLKKSRTGLMTFAIWGRNFSLDGSPATSSSSANQISPFTFMLMMLVILGIGSTYSIAPVPNAA